MLISPGWDDCDGTASSPRSASPSPVVPAIPGGRSLVADPFPELPLGSIRASTWPTSTVSSGAARIFVITPLAGAGTSASILSVETSTTVSPSATA